ARHGPGPARDRVGARARRRGRAGGGSCDRFAALRRQATRSARAFAGDGDSRGGRGRCELPPRPPSDEGRSDGGPEVRMIDALAQDLRYALRTFARSPALVAAAVVCLALGIGANATIFGVVDTLLFRAPPRIKDPERVVRLYFRRRYPAFGTSTSSTTGYPLYTLIR